ncbi:MAG: hypothetical protein VYD90_11200 [Pseudomonadota bacterium]|nr:hypothetical protein [Pseudomonadota bacterium]
MSRLPITYTVRAAGLRGPGGKDGTSGADGTDGTLAAASDAEVLAQTDNTKSVTPLNSAALADLRSQIADFVALSRDASGNVLTWMKSGLFESYGLGPTLMAYIEANISLGAEAYSTATDGRNFAKFGAGLKNMIGSAGGKNQPHLWIVGDSWTERVLIPQAILNWLRDKGLETVATGWIGINSAFGNIGAGSRRLFDGAINTGTIASTTLTITAVDPSMPPIEVGQYINGTAIIEGTKITALGTGTGGTGTYTINNAHTVASAQNIYCGSYQTFTSLTLIDASEDPLSGEMGPDGFRGTFVSSDTTGAWSVFWKGRYLDIWHTDNAATWRHSTDGGANNDVTNASSGDPTKTTIDAGSEGWHWTAISRPTATDDFVVFGAMTRSELPGLIVSKAGNGNSEMTHHAYAVSTTTAQAIMGDIFPDDVVGTTSITKPGSGSPTVFDVTRRTSVLLMILTNDSRNGATAATFSGALTAWLDDLRAIDSGLEILFAVPSRNAISGLTNGNDIGVYVPSVFSAATNYGIDVENFYARDPAHADSDTWEDSLHKSIEGGGAEAMASQLAHDFWRLD